MKYLVTYRDTEVSAEIEANTSDEAFEKFLAGDCEFSVHVDFFHPEFVEVDEDEAEYI